MPRKKATTPEPEMPQRHARYSSTPAFVGGVFVVGAIVIAGAVLVGKSDKGQIDVTAAIQNANQANIDAGGDAANNVQVVPEEHRKLPNGGLVSKSAQPDGAPQPETTVTPDDQASTTEATPENGAPAESAETPAPETTTESENAGQ